MPPHSSNGVKSTAPTVTLRKADGAQVELHEKLIGYGIDLEAASGQDHHILPVPAVFLIGRDAKIDFRYYNPDYKERLSGEALMKAARANQAK